MLVTVRSVIAQRLDQRWEPGKRISLLKFTLILLYCVIDTVNATAEPNSIWYHINNFYRPKGSTRMGLA